LAVTVQKVFGVTFYEVEFEDKTAGAVGSLYKLECTELRLLLGLWDSLRIIQNHLKYLY
jgi:hypothetical protein